MGHRHGGKETETLMIDATYLKAHRANANASLMDQKGSLKARRVRLIGRTNGGLNSGLHVMAAFPDARVIFPVRAWEFPCS